MNIKIAGRIKHSLVNGPGVRYVLFCQGCNHHCFGCQNPDTWSLDGGTDVSVESIYEEISKIKYLDGITLSGGDPLLQYESLIQLLTELKPLNLNIWCYTGFTYNEVLNSPMKKILPLLDVLVDGRFELDKKLENLLYRGSTNQKIIDVKKSLVENSIIEYKDNGLGGEL